MSPQNSFNIFISLKKNISHIVRHCISQERSEHLHKIVAFSATADYKKLSTEFFTSLQNSIVTFDRPTTAHSILLKLPKKKRYETFPQSAAIKPNSGIYVYVPFVRLVQPPGCPVLNVYLPTYITLDAMRTGRNFLLVIFTFPRYTRWVFQRFIARHCTDLGSL